MTVTMNKCKLTDRELYGLIGVLEGCGVIFPEDLSTANYLRIYRLFDAFKYGVDAVEVEDEENV